MDNWKEVGEGTSNNQWRFTLQRYWKQKHEAWTDGIFKELSLSNEAGRSQTISVLQNLSQLMHIINFLKRHVTTTSWCWALYLYSQSHWLKHEFVMCYFITLRKWISSNKNLTEADLWHTQHENSMWECS